MRNLTSMLYNGAGGRFEIFLDSAIGMNFRHLSGAPRPLQVSGLEEGEQ